MRASTFLRRFQRLTSVSCAHCSCWVVRKGELSSCRCPERREPNALTPPDRGASVDYRAKPARESTARSFTEAQLVAMPKNLPLEAAPMSLRIKTTRVLGELLKLEGQPSVVCLQSVAIGP
jgi:hypothetical protein